MAMNYYFSFIAVGEYIIYKPFQHIYQICSVLKNTKLFIITIIWNHQILTVLNLIRRKFVNLFHFCNIIINRLIII